MKTFRNFINGTQKVDYWNEKNYSPRLKITKDGKVKQVQFPYFARSKPKNNYFFVFNTKKKKEKKRK